MTSGWTVTYAARAFIKPIEDFREELVRLNDEVEAFSSAVEAIRSGSSDVILSLRSARDLGQGPSLNYYVLRVGAWRGYYWIDHSHQICQGHLAIRKSTKTAADLIAALKEAAGELAKKPADPKS